MHLGLAEPRVGVRGPRWRWCSASSTDLPLTACPARPRPPTALVLLLLLPQDIINKSRQELVSQLGLHAQLCDELYSAVAANICPEPRSVLDCMQAKQAAVCFLRTGMASFDKILRGGIPCGGITEIVGPAGAGKTQFCLQSCVRAIGECGAHGSAIYIDTVCHSQSLVRLALPAANCLPVRIRSVFCQHSSIDRVACKRRSRALAQKGCSRWLRSCTQLYLGVSNANSWSAV